MKKTTLTLLALGTAVSVFAQGTVTFNNASSGNGVSTRVFGPEAGNAYAIVVGNRSNDTPTGTQVYTGALLTGSGYVAQLFGANGAGVDAGSLVAATSAATTFRTGTGAGVVAATTAVFGNIPLDAAVGTFQLRVWDNTSGLYADWASASVAWQAGLIAAGMSPTVNINAIGGQANTPPYLAGLQSFNIYMIPVPEPSTFVLAGLGAAGLLIFRRRK